MSFIFLNIIVAIFSLNLTHASEFPQPKEEQFKHSLAFWVQIYTQYDTRQGIIHDSEYLDKVYEIIDLSTTTARQAKKLISQSKRKWKKVLLELAKRKEDLGVLSKEEEHVFRLFPPSMGKARFKEAALGSRMRFQLGQKDQFSSAIKMSGKYLSYMEEVFRNEGLPIELSRIPFIESSFNLKARSKVGASGIWQFMPSTGKLFMKINAYVDERNDPIIATLAAARLLKQNYESLNSWPLAITAYNHGRNGMMNAVKKTGLTDFENLISNHKNRKFGFASKNFYWEFLAALEVEKNKDKYFPKIIKEEMISYVPVTFEKPVSILKLAELLDITRIELKEYNPGFKDSVWLGRLKVPKKYPIKIPKKIVDKNKNFLINLENKIK